MSDQVLIGCEKLRDDPRTAEILTVMSRELEQQITPPLGHFFIRMHGDYATCRTAVVRALGAAGPDWRDHFRVLTLADHPSAEQAP